MTIKKITIVGSGPMANAYHDVLAELRVDHLIVGNTGSRRMLFSQVTDDNFIRGGIPVAVDQKVLTDWAIVAVPIPSLALVVRQLVQAGVKNILVEKPGALDHEELSKLKEYVEENNANVRVAYNRRFLSSVAALKNRLVSDGGATSMSFEFTEWGHVVKNLNHPREVMETWLIANSSHVIDLAFFLCGEPLELNCSTLGGLPWHTKSSRFSGSGVTIEGCVFSYLADWSSAGRWAIDVRTSRASYSLKPLEHLYCCKVGSLESVQLKIDDAIDAKFKPGLHRMVTNFLSGDHADLPELGSQLNRWKIYEKIAGY